MTDVKLKQEGIWITYEAYIKQILSEIATLYQADCCTSLKLIFNLAIGKGGYGESLPVMYRRLVSSVGRAPVC